MLQPQGRLIAHGQGSRSGGDTAPANTLIATGALKNTPLVRNTAAAASKIREVQRAWHAGDACAGDPTRQPRRAASTAGGKNSSRVRGWRPTGNRTAEGQSCQHTVSSKPPATSWHQRPLLQWWHPPSAGLQPPAGTHGPSLQLWHPGCGSCLLPLTSKGAPPPHAMEVHAQNFPSICGTQQGPAGSRRVSRVLAMLCRIAPRLMQQPTDSRPTHACTRMCCGGFAKHRALPRVS